MSKSYGNRTLYIRQRDGDNGTWSNWLRLLDESDLTWDNIAGKPNTFTPSAHDHNYVLDIANNSHTTFAYSKPGLSKDSITWLAVWNGYELRAMNKDQVALSGHTHTYIVAEDLRAKYPG